MKRAEAFQVVGMLVAGYPTPAWTEETMKLYAQQLEDLDVEISRVAALEWIRTEANRPTIAELRRKVARLNAESEGHAQLAAEEAWGFVVECFTRVGSYRDFPDTYPRVKEAVDAIGWRELCLSENQVADRAHFYRTYSALLERDSAAAARSQHARLPEVRLRQLPGGRA